jgi:hypothetical protein
MSSGDREPSVYRNEPGGDDLIIDPASIDASGAEPAEPPFRRRKQQSDAGQSRGAGGGSGAKGTRAKTGKVSVDLTGLAGMLAGCMTMASLNFNAPEWQVGEVEAKEYLVHVQNVMRHYSADSTQKSIDVAMLIFASSMFLGTRSAATMVRLREEREGKRAPGKFGGVVRGPWPNVMPGDVSGQFVVPDEFGG